MTTKICAIGDVHDSPRIPKDRLTWISQDIAKNKPSEVVLIGDFFTFDSLCTHMPNDTYEAWREKPTFEEDLASGFQALERLTWDILIKPFTKFCFSS